MLYVSTRDKTDSFTAYRALHEERAPDGGLFVPFRIPFFSKTEILSLKEKGFSETIAQVLNLFFSTGLTGWDVDFAIGRNPVRLKRINRHLFAGELWHNPGSNYTYTERNLYNKLCGTREKQPTDWAKIAIRIAALFGTYGALSREGVTKPDVAIPAGDFSTPMAVWYARKMGLPIGTIICGCNENGAAWELIHRGEFSTGQSVVRTELTGLDHACPASIERLIYSVFGINETLRYVDICAQRGLYTLNDEALQQLNDGFFAAVVSGRRARSVIVSTFRSNRYIIDGYAATAYGSLQDYRTYIGESRNTVLLVDASPICLKESIAKTLRISVDELKKNL